MRHANLTIKITYDNETNTSVDQAIESQLKYCAEHLANNGLLSGDGELLVERWESDVTFHI